MSKNNASNSEKLFAWMGLIIAGLILLVGAVLQQQGNSLPEQVTDFAADVVATAVVELGLAEGAPLATPKPAQTTEDTAPVSANEDAPWTDADINFDYYVLALSWQPAFCETRPTKEECVSQHAGRYDAQNFALHGLWPNLENDPQHTFGYCGVAQAVMRQDKNNAWCALPTLALSDAVWGELSTVMPGATSCLHNHEWYKHGTCAGLSADAYFALSNHLTALFSQTAFDDYVAANVGQTVKRRTLLDTFASEFGADASDYLSLRCSKVAGVSLLTEIQIALRPDIPADVNFGTLFPTDDIRPSGSCPAQFKIDKVGLDNF